MRINQQWYDGLKEIIPCVCGEDIDDHLLCLNETNGSYFSGPCMKPGTKCNAFRLKSDKPLSEAQAMRLDPLQGILFI